MFGPADAVEDVREECQKFGPVVSLLVPKESPGRGQVSGRARHAAGVHRGEARCTALPACGERRAHG